MTKIFPHCTISVGLAPLADYINVPHTSHHVYNSDGITRKRYSVGARLSGRTQV